MIKARTVGKSGLDPLALAIHVAIGLACGLGISTDAEAQSCDPSLTISIHATEQLVYSLSAGDVQSARWMHGELGLIREACSRGNDVEAAWRLEKIQLGVANAGKLEPERQIRQVTRRDGGKRSPIGNSRNATRKTRMEQTRPGALKAPWPDAP
ncbi:MAG: hypothetical protein ACLQO1_19290 [Steroidobacteraceae bacterium]